MRAFVAVAVEEPAVVDALRAAVGRLRRVGGVKWVAPGQYHFTLQFLGEIPEERVEAAGGALARSAAASRAFRLRLERLGAFPPAGPPRVVWAGCSEGGEALEALGATVRAELAAVGFPPEERPFSAHLTLGRVKDPRSARGLREALASGGDPAFGLVPVGELRLLRSRLTPSGPEYSPLRTARLGG